MIVPPTQMLFCSSHNLMDITQSVRDESERVTSESKMLALGAAVDRLSKQICLLYRL